MPADQGGQSAHHFRQCVGLQASPLQFALELLRRAIELLRQLWMSGSRGRRPACTSSRGAPSRRQPATPREAGSYASDCVASTTDTMKPQCDQSLNLIAGGGDRTSGSEAATGVTPWRCRRQFPGQSARAGTASASSAGGRSHPLGPATSPCPARWTQGPSSPRTGTAPSRCT